MNSPKVTIGVVLFGTNFLEQSLPSLVQQDYPNVEYLFRDHSPTGEAMELIEQKLPDVAQKSENSSR
jgi:hypothetical protein